MPLYKFESLLKERALYLTKITNFVAGDELEGQLTPKSIEWLMLFDKRHGGHHDENFWKVVQENMRVRHFASCWHRNTYENELMWRDYCKMEGICVPVVAIQTTFHQLDIACEQASDAATDNRAFYVGRVDYIPDWDEYFINTDNMFRRFLHKQAIYHREQETRVCSESFEE